MDDIDILFMQTYRQIVLTLYRFHAVWSQEGHFPVKCPLQQFPKVQSLGSWPNRV